MRLQSLYSQPIQAGTDATTSLPPFPSVTTQREFPQGVQDGLFSPLGTVCLALEKLPEAALGWTFSPVKG